MQPDATSPRLLAALALLFFACMPLLSPGDAQGGDFETARIDWLRLEASGSSDPDESPQQATLTARKRLLSVLRGVSVSAELPASDRLRRDRKAAERLRVLALSSPVEDTGTGLRAALPLRGEVLSLLLPAAAQFNTGLPPRLAVEPARPGASLESVEKGLLQLRAKPPVGTRPLESFAGRTAALPAPAAAPEVVDEEHSGLVVDARGLELRRALLPGLYDDSGQGLYGAFLVARGHVVQNGLVVYAADLNDAALRQRVGEAPLVVRAAALAQVGGPDLVLGAEDAAAVRSLLRGKAVPARCAVAILAD